MNRPLVQGLDVHKINSVRVFDALGESLFYNLVFHCLEDELYFPEFPSDVTPYSHELRAIDSPFRNGFSDFEWLEVVNPRKNWELDRNPNAPGCPPEYSQIPSRKEGDTATAATANGSPSSQCFSLSTSASPESFKLSDISRRVGTALRFFSTDGALDGWMGGWMNALPW